MHVVSLLASLTIVLCTAPLMAGETRGVSNPAELNSAIASAKPGTTINVADGTYSDWAIICATSGSADRPITIAAASPGGVIFTGSGTHFLVTSAMDNLGH